MIDKTTWSKEITTLSELNHDDNEEMTLCFSGHRPNGLYGYAESSRANYSKLCNNLMALCEDMMQTFNITHFVSGGAQGIDQLSFWAVEKLKAKYPDRDIANIVFIPYEGYGLKWPANGMFAQSEFQKIMEKCDGWYQVSKAGYSTKALFDRNLAMLDVSDICLACWNKDTNWNNTNGGTADCIRQAVKAGKKTYVYTLKNSNVVQVK